MGYLILIKGIIGDKEKSKVEDKLSITLSIEDCSKYLVINQRESDCFVFFIDKEKVFKLKEFFEELGVIIGFKKLNLDEILDKINHLGVGSLDTYEKEYLDAHKYTL